MPQPLLIFLHLPKTAGTTLWLILRRQYSPGAVCRVNTASEALALAEPQLTQMQVLLGHIPYGVHPPLSQAPTYITVLRDPVERTLSRYSHIVRHLYDDPALSPPDGPVPTMTHYLATGFGEKDNWQTRSLAGAEAVALPFGQCDRDVFEQAKCNVVADIAVAGLTERFDETVVLMQRHFGWAMPCYVNENVGTDRITRDQVPEEVMTLIRQQTQWDQELYAFAATRLQEQIAHQGPAFSDALRRFRAANASYQQMKALAGGPLGTLKRLLPLDRQMRIEATVRAFLAGLSRPRPPQ